MPAPDSLDIENALIFFHAYMYGPLRGKMRLYRARGLSPRMVMSEDWEVFASILVRDPGTPTQSGLDLEQFEVKSAKDNGSFEYQYHRDSWEKKFDADLAAGHLFISHRDQLEFVEVRYCDGVTLADRFNDWRSEEPYSDDSQQRFRKHISYRDACDRGTLLLRVEAGEATYIYQAEKE